MLKRFVLVLVLVLILAISGAGLVNAADLGLDASVVEFKLSNGMKWLLVRRPVSPVFSGIIQVKVGSIEEVKGKTGLAHMLEHMAFKGTKELSGEKLWDAFTSNGAVGLNAFTSKDITGYHASMPSSKLSLWLYLNSEMIKHSVPREFFKERDVVMEERRSSVENDPKGKMYNVLLETAFKTSPYKWSTIGSAEDVAGLQPEDLAAFKKKYYTAPRMVGALVGDIDIGNAKTLIEKYFGDIPAPVKRAAEKFPVEEPQNSERRETVKFNASPSMLMAYHKPTLPQYDDYVFDILTYILCDGENSRLQKAMVQDKKMVQFIACDSSSPGARLDNLFLLITNPVKGHSYKEVESAVIAEFEKLKVEPPSDDEMKAAKNNLVAQFVFELLNNGGLAQSLAYFETIAGDWRYIIKHQGIVDGIKPADVSDVAKKYFIDSNKTVVELSR